MRRGLLFARLAQFDWRSRASRLAARGLLFAGLLGCCAGVGTAPARAESLTVSLSTDQVAITSTYTGSSVVAFGIVERDAQTVARGSGYDVIVTVLGPRQPIVVREKRSFGPIWINRAQQAFLDAPTYLGVFASRPLAEITSDALRRRYGLGVDAVIGAAEPAKARGPQGAPFREALIRLRARDELFAEDERAVAFLTPTVFRAAIPVPATAPPGAYAVDVALLSDGVLLARRQMTFQLVKTGFEESMGELARDRPLAYGGATAALALLLGWLASVTLRRD
jgi:uncharacterized protein (TIGR02186 family)